MRARARHTKLETKNLPAPAVHGYQADGYGYGRGRRTPRNHKKEEKGAREARIERGWVQWHPRISRNAAAQERESVSPKAAATIKISDERAAASASGDATAAVARASREPAPIVPRIALGRGKVWPSHNVAPEINLFGLDADFVELGVELVGPFLHAGTVGGIAGDGGDGDGVGQAGYERVGLGVDP
ncbi:hypothetical protein B0H16DRAFT_1688284 [Mycena metata]|uniref:Uncharacterized protein n=1 Tax=Mycena metata TaxID=1033252 RepID=A0AAD7NIR2_9AGAR|nr:hypothetical protein B0H16DRAFT_1688284 [Mycena metata]